MNTETDFRSRVEAGEWPSTMRHGTAGTRYDYAVANAILSKRAHSSRAGGAGR